MTPCKDDSDFMPDAAQDVWCEFRDAWPSAEACQQAGCHHYEETIGDNVEDRCWCEEAEPCGRLGGTFFTRTCGEMANDWSFEHRVLQDAQASGTCDGATFPWGEPLDGWLRHHAEKCCASFPATLCNPEARVRTVCASQEDFMPDASAQEYCDYRGQEPQHEACEAAGFCHCHREDACEFFGGSFERVTCME
jgi:hypothetical protein